LGSDYIVWDKAATIQFKKPGKCKLFAGFNVSDEEVNFIKDELENTRSMDRVYRLNITDREDTLYAIVVKTIYIRKKTKPLMSSPAR
jgi:hypothetical protein